MTSHAVGLFLTYVSTLADFLVGSRFLRLEAREDQLWSSWSQDWPTGTSGRDAWTTYHQQQQQQLYSSAHFASRNIFLLSTLCFIQHIASWTLFFLCPREQSMLRRTFYKGAKCSREQSIPRRSVPGSKMCWEAKSLWKKSVPGIKICLKSKMFLKAKDESAKYAKKQSVLGSKVCVSQINCSKQFDENAVHVHNPITIQFKLLLLESVILRWKPRTFFYLSVTVIQASKHVKMVVRTGKKFKLKPSKS